MIKILDFKADTQPVNIILKSLFSVLHTPDKNIEIIIKETLLGYIYIYGWLHWFTSYSIKDLPNFDEGLFSISPFHHWAKIDG